MREKLNSNPIFQIALIGVLLIGTGFFLLSSGGGGGEEEVAGTEATVSFAGTDVSGSATGATPGEAVESAIDAAGSATAGATSSFAAQTTMDAPPPPKPVREAWQANKTVVLLFIRDGGIDDRLVKIATDGVAGFADVEVFVVKAAQIYRYASIAQGVGVDRVPALVAITPKNLKGAVPTASVSYGFQSPQSVAQAVIDAGYDGPTVDYHP